MGSKTAFITGVTGQDGAYLSKLLIELGYKVVGGYRRTSNVDFWRLESLGIIGNTNFELVEHDLIDLSSNISILHKYQPDEIYNLAAQSFVGVSFSQPNTTAQITGIGALNILEAIRISELDARFYQASTSEMFGLVQQVPQNEETNFYPRSPYGVSKLFAHWMTVNYRESYGIFASSGILFNHESPRRGKEFVTRKITETVARISLGSNEQLTLGNLDAQRDWGYAEEYVEGMWRMLQAEKPDTFVLSTNKTTAVRYFVKMAFASVGLEIEFSGDGVNEVGVSAKTGKTLVQVSDQFFRPAEVDLLLGDASKAKRILGWESRTSVSQLCQMMVEADIDRQKRGFTR